MNACKIVTIKERTKLFKDGQEAERIELITLEEVGNTIVSQKGLYKAGDRALFIQPDFSLPDTQIFSDFWYPGGDSSKSKLGSRGRIKAIKFNFSLEDGTYPVYSYGILMPLSELPTIHKDEDLDKKFGITKWSEPEERCSNSASLGGDSNPFPEGMYKTDEENINNLWGQIEYPIELIGTQKIDGSSITIYCKKDSNNNWKSGICSRTLEKRLTTRKCVGVRKATIWERFKSFFKFRTDLRLFEEVPSTNEFVIVGRPYMDLLVEYCKATDQQLSLRGELCGKGLRGSGNKNNPTVTENPNIKFYAVDKIQNNISLRCDEKTFDEIITHLEFDRCPVICTKIFNSRKEIEDFYTNIFKSFKEHQNILMEGVVLKTLDGRFSTKLMNLEYDLKK